MANGDVLIEMNSLMAVTTPLPALNVEPLASGPLQRLILSGRMTLPAGRTYGVKMRLPVSVAVAASGVLMAGITAIAPAVAAPVAKASVGDAARMAQRARMTSAVAGHELRPQAPGSLRLGGGFTGIVLGATGRPMRGPCVTATGVSATTSAVTDQGGRYLLTAGSYVVSYRDCAAPARYFEQWSGRADLPDKAGPILVSPGQQTSLRPVTLRSTSAAVFMAGTSQRLVTISGTVRSRSGKRLAGICAFAYPPGNYFAGAGVITSRRGNYSFAGILTAGKYLVQFMSECGNSGNYAPQWWKDSATQANAKVLKLKAGEKATHIDASLGPGGALSGTVRAAGTGTPLGGVCVRVTSTDPQEIYQFQVTTKPDGTYSLTSMATGRYRLQFQPDCGNTGNYLGASRRHAVLVTAGKRTTGVNADLPPGAAISGVVTGPGATPLSGICVFMDGNAPSATTGPDGSYSIQRLGAGGGYQIGFAGGCGETGSYAPQFYPGHANPAAAGSLSLSSGEVRTGVDASLEPGGTVTGSVTNATGARLSGICVAVLAPAATEPNDQNLFVPFKLMAVPDLGVQAQTRNGSYEARNLAPGQYYVTFSPCNGTRYAPQWFAGQSAFANGSLISVGAGSTTTGVDAVLPRSGSITGVVASAAGHRLNGICVSAVNLAGQDPINYAPEVLSHRGAYRITGLAPGRYSVLFGACGGSSHYAAQWFPAAASEASARPVTVRAGQTTTPISTILAGGGSISGRVTSAVPSKAPKSFCIVAAADSAGNVMSWAVTSKTGSYDLRHLRAGRYDVQACEPPAAGVIRPGIVVTKSRATTGVAVRLPRTGSLTGTVLDGAGKAPEPGVCVTAFPQSGQGFVRVVSTVANGSYHLGGLNPGSYQVLFSPVCLAGFADVAPQWFDGQPSQGSATRVTVIAGQTRRGIDARLPAFGGISGTVTDAAHSPVAGICVSAAARVRDAVPVVAVTATNGTYALGDLAPGKYTLKFGSGCGATGYVTQYYSGVSSAQSASPVAVIAAMTTTAIDATMTR